MKKFAIAPVLFLVFAQLVFSQDKLAIFDSYVEKARKEWNVPGISVAIVQDGKIVLSKGYGEKELGKGDPVDTKTLFGAMSTTKAMTVAALGMLVDEGKADWDDKVIKHLPEFKLADSYVTRELRIRDLLTHNGGVGNADFLWFWTPGLSAEKVVGRMQYAKQAYPIRGGFAYQNIMYLVAGRVIERLSGMSWDRFMTERLFKPLGMNDTFPNFELSKRYQNRSTAHFEINGKIEPISEMVADSVAPAGAVWSTSDDIGKWVNFMLNNPKTDGKQLLKPATFAEILRPQAIIPKKEFYPTSALTQPNWMTYGLGWFQHDYRGEIVNFHTGSLAGRTAIVGLLAEKKLGIYIFGNLDHAEVRHALMYKAFDLFGFGDGTRDWSSDLKSLYGGLKAKSDKQAEAVKSKRTKNTKPSLPLSAYVGTYSDPFYGTAEVKSENGKLRLVMSTEFQGELNHWHFDSFQAAWDKKWFGETLISFRLSAASGEVESVLIGGIVLKRK